MKKILLLIFTLTGSLLATAQVQSSCSSSATLQTLYGKDIAHLALVHMYNTQSPDTIGIDIPQPYIDSVGRAMAAVFNLNSQLEADSVMRRHCIRQDNYLTELHLSGARNGVTLQVKVDSFKAWTAGWRNLNAVTGYATLDALMAHYGFQVNSYIYIGGSITDNTAMIHTPQVINAKAFADSLRKLDGILDVWYSPNAGDGNYIRYSYENGAAHLMFRLGWGDCPMGCTADKRWYYKIDDQCRVTLDSVRIYLAPGPYPIPGNCGITGLQDPQQSIRFSVYPNPATDVLNLVMKDRGNYTYQLSDTYGRLIRKGNVKGNIAIYLGGFGKGIYLLQVSDKQGNRRSEKIILE